MSLELALVITVGVTLLGIISGAPIGYVFGLACLVLLFTSGNPDGLGFVVSATISFLQGYAFLAVPLYIMVGSLMLRTALSKHLFDFVYSVLGKARASFGSALVIFIAIFGAMTGSAAAAIAALGSLAIPEGPRYGYHREHVSGLVGCASLVAMLIPPSITMIIFGIASQVSIPLLFLATAIPGMLTALAFIGVNFVLIKRWSITPTGTSPVTGQPERLRKAAKAWAVLILPVIILGGIYGGVFTPTEAAAVAVAWILVYQLLASAMSAITQKSISPFKAGMFGLVTGFVDAGRILGALGAVIFFMFALSRVMIWANMGDVVMSVFAATISNKVIFLLVANITLLIMGMIMDDVSGCILAGVFLLPVAVNFGVNPLHFGAIVGVNLGLGNLTPPVAPLLYLAAGIGNVKVKFYPPNIYIKSVIYLLVFGQLPVLILVTCLPQLSLFLPNLWMAAR